MAEGGKSLLLISESLLLQRIVPKDLLEPSRFDLRSVKTAKEILALSKDAATRAVIVDLRKTAPLTHEIGEVIQEMRELTAKRKLPLIPVFGLTDKVQPRDRQRFFEVGVSTLLFPPYSRDDLQHEFQAILGLGFRRFERKGLSVPVELVQGKETFRAMAKVINLECLAVEGTALPALYTNVFLKSAPGAPVQFNLWTYCWRVNEQKQLLLRFLDPPGNLLVTIERLPSNEVVSESTAAPAALDSGDPRRYAPIAWPAAFEIFSAALQNPEGAPAGYREILEKITDAEKAMLKRAIDAKAAFAEILVLKILFDWQLRAVRGAAALDAKEAVQTTATHERLLAQAGKALQQMIDEHVDEGDLAAVSTLNEVKSTVQKTYIAIQKTLTNKGVLEGGGARSSDMDQLAKEAEKSVTGNRRSAGKPKAAPAPSGAKKFGASTVTVLILAVCAAYVIYAWRAPLRARHELSASDIKAISSQCASVTEIEDQGKTKWVVQLHPSWTNLTAEAQKAETELLAAKMKALQVDIAVLQTAEGRQFAVFKEGKMNVLPKPPPGRKGSRGSPK